MISASQDRQPKHPFSFHCDVSLVIHQFSLNQVSNIPRARVVLTDIHGVCLCVLSSHCKKDGKVLSLGLQYSEQIVDVAGHGNKVGKALFYVKCGLQR